MHIPAKHISYTIIKKYNPDSLVHKDHIVVEIRKGMYGFPQAGILAEKRLVKPLAASGYHQTNHNPDLFTHEWPPITFCLIVNNFGIKPQLKEHASPLVSTSHSI